MCYICGMLHYREEKLKLPNKSVSMCQWCAWELHNGIILKCDKCGRYRFLEKTGDNLVCLSAFYRIPIIRFESEDWVCSVEACDRCDPAHDQAKYFIARLDFKKYH